MPRLLVLALGFAAVLLAGVGASAYFGAFNVAADAPHSGVTSRVLALIRDRSIAARAAELTVPNLADRDLIATGAELYTAMCTGCHLAPGITNSELRAGLYPEPPDLSAGTSRRPAEAFWVIKHGIKMSAMPAWGGSHDDATIWAIVAFLQQLPTLDAKAYAALTGQSGAADHEHENADHDPVHNEAASRAAAESGEATMNQPAVAEHGHTHPHDSGHSTDLGG
jgi:mono/diheme cytochrome c family protein